ncbi:hypothetical protein IFR05_013770 [Cadophora sp. M221]|nr:hypothetical protein IFR05_013770 [Cadophora sp. M221]
MSGLEVVGSIASVVQLAGTVYAISKTLYEVGDALSNAPADIKDLARDLETFSEELHLLSSLLDGRHRYSDRVYGLTAKIIGNCATICVKIDRILKKLRGESVWARVRWLYKEKEIMKLLTRLRDLKLSLMGTLSLLSALKADHMMDALGVPNGSLLGGQNDERVAEQTMRDMQETRKKLAGITMKQSPEPSVSETSGLTLQQSQDSTSFEALTTTDTFPAQEVCGNPSLTSFASTSTLAFGFTSEPQSSNVFMSAIALSGPNSIMQNRASMDSMQSFHSAVSYQTESPSQWNVDQTTELSTSYSRHVPISETQVPPYQKWRKAMVDSALSHFQITREQAEAWADSLPVPALSAANPPPIPASQTFNPQPPMTLSFQYSLSRERESPDLWSSNRYSYASSGTISGHARMQPPRPTSELQPGRREIKVAYRNHPSFGRREEFTTPGKQGTADLTDEKFSEIDKLRIPLSLRQHRMLPQPVPPWITTWEELKQWVSDDSNLPPEALRVVNKAQKSHYLQLTRQVRHATPQDVPQMSPPDISFSNAAMGHSSLGASYCRIPIGLNLGEHPSAQEIDKLRRIPSGTPTEARDGMARKSVDEMHEQQMQQKLRMQMALLKQPLGGIQEQQTQQKLRMQMALLKQQQLPQSMQLQRGTRLPSHGSSDSRSQSYHRQKFTQAILTPPDKATQLWWKALRRLDEEDHDAAVRLTAELKRTTHLQAAESSEAKVTNATRTSMEDMLAHLHRITKQASNAEPLLNSMSRIAAIAQVMVETLKFRFGPLVWVCFGKDVQSCPFMKHELETCTTKMRYFADIATLIARYNVLESIYQQWSGMSLDPDYERAIIDLCVLVLAYIARFLQFGEAGSPRAQALGSQMGKIVEADSKCRGFTVTFSVDRRVEDLSEDDSDSDDAVPINKSMKRSLSDISNDITMSPSSKKSVHENNYTSLPVAEIPASKRIRSQYALP